MKNPKTILRLLLGLAYFAFGINFFIPYLPMPQDTPQAAADFGKAMFATGYLFPFIKGTEVVCGLLLLTNMFVPLALVILAPITLNIVLFHGFLAPSGMYLQVAMLAVHLILGFHYYRGSYRTLLHARS